MALIERKRINSQSITKTFPMLALEQFERLITSHNVEFRGGFYLKIGSMNGEQREIYVEDTREVFCNTCKALTILIMPFFSDKMKSKYDDIKKRLEKLKKDFLDSTSVEESIVLGEAFYEKEEDKILLEQYNNMKVELYQGLFEALSFEFGLKRYWKGQSTDD
jgi:hypothetical protein